MTAFCYSPFQIKQLTKNLNSSDGVQSTKITYNKSVDSPSVQDETGIRDKKNFTVAVRIKPQLNSDISNLISLSVKNLLNKNQQLKLSFEGKRFEYNTYGQRSQKKYVFDKIFQGQSQNTQIFQSFINVKLGLLKKGVNLSIMAYGATNSGKTYTIFGKKQEQQRKSVQGLSYLTFKSIFEQSEKDYTMSFSFVQIYNENVYDLLNPLTTSNPLNVMEDSQGNTNVIGLSKIQINCFKQLQKLMDQGNNARISSSNVHNLFSSRSHAFMEMEIKHKKTKQRTKMVIVDLAGSQKYVYNSSNFATNGCNLLKEGSNINKSLLSLGNCIKSLQQSDQHIPYRDSKLTRLLKQNLSGYAHNIMIACINKKANNFEENLNSLNYALKAMKIQKQIVRKVQSQELSQFQCLNCQQKLPYSLIKDINKHEEHRKRVKTQQSRSLSVSPISKNNQEYCCFKTKSKDLGSKAKISKLQKLIDQSFMNLLSKFPSDKAQFLQLTKAIQSEKSGLKRQFKHQILHSLPRKQDSQDLFNKSIVVSQFQQSFQHIERSNPIVSQHGTSISNKDATQRSVAGSKRLKISLSKPKRQLQRTVSTNNSVNSKLQSASIHQQIIQAKFYSTNDPIKVQDESLSSDPGIHSFRSNLTVQILDDKDKILNQRRQVLEQSLNNKRKSNPKISNILKFKSNQNVLRNKNIQNFISAKSFQDRNNKIKYDFKDQFMKVQHVPDKLIQSFDDFVINQRLLDSTSIAPRMKRDQDELGMWKNISIKNVQSPSNLTSHKKPQFDQSFVEQRIQVFQNKQKMKRVFRY